MTAYEFAWTMIDTDRNGVNWEEYSREDALADMDNLSREWELELDADVTPEDIVNAVRDIIGN